VTIYLGVEEILDIAAIAVGGPPKVRDHGLLAAAAARPETSVFGQDAYPTLAEKAAALLHSLCANHALVDGNKRLAWMAAVTLVWLNTGVEPKEVDEPVAEAFMLAVATGSLTDVAGIAAELRRLGIVD
jgi:death-on-curing protein